MNHKIACTFSLAPDTVATINEVAAAKCNGNISAAVRLIVAEWEQIEHDAERDDEMLCSARVVRMGS